MVCRKFFFFFFRLKGKFSSFVFKLSDEFVRTIEQTVTPVPFVKFGLNQLNYVIRRKIFYELFTVVVWFDRKQN